MYALKVRNKSDDNLEDRDKLKSEIWLQFESVSSVHGRANKLQHM